MMLVSRPLAPPHLCAVTGRSEDPHGFMDTGVTLPGFEPRIYISHHGAARLMEAFGFPTPYAHADALDEIARLRTRLAELESENAGMAAQLEAVAVLKRYGARAERKPGRPAKAAA